MTFTGRSAQNVGFDDPQPGLWPLGDIQQQSAIIAIAYLPDELTLRMKGRHINEGASIAIDGRKVAGTVSCEFGVLPNCQDEVILITLSDIPEDGGMYFLQVQNPNGKFSNDTMFFSDLAPVPPRTGNLIGSGGRFTGGEDGNWRTNQFVGSVAFTNGRVEFNIDSANESIWFMELTHWVMLVKDQQYTFCFKARADATRPMTARVDNGANSYRAMSVFEPTLSTVNQVYSVTFTADETDVDARVVFQMAQSSINAQLDDVGLYEGDACGSP